MAHFLKAAEVWQLDVAEQQLVLASAHYGSHLSDFESASQSMAFDIDEGLPGKTWAERRPLIWADLNTEHFKRKELAQIAGLVCGLSIPVFAGEFLLGVVVLFFAKKEEATGVVEIWQNRDYYDNELRLVDGYYGQLKKFEYTSRNLTIMRGRGLPGVAWQRACPVVVPDLADSGSFLRARNAAASGLAVGLAVPFFYTDRDVQVVAMLSSEVTPAARRVEVWRPDESHRYLLFNDGFCAEGTDLQVEYRGVACDRGESVLGSVWLSGRPCVEIPDRESGEGAVYIPFIHNGLLAAIVKLVF